MRLLQAGSLLLSSAALAGAARHRPRVEVLRPRADDGVSSAVSWDSFSFAVQPDARAAPQRIFVQSGEIHPWRLPVPDLWPDVMQKAKAAGLSTISFYGHWALMNPKSGVIDTEGFNDLQPFFDAAKAAGLWVIARPGPYINSETSGGGIPGWVTVLPGNPSWNAYNGELRSNDTFFHDSWQDYVKTIGTVIAKNQVTNGGPVIMVQVENEYYNGPGQNEYVTEVKNAFRAVGVVVPTMVNDPGEFRNLVNETDIYGIDAYPVHFSCATPNVWADVPTNWRTFHNSVNPQVPQMFPEFQGGSMNGWGNPFGYENCRQLTGPNFQRVFYHQLWAQGVTAENFYMFYGGTNWGQISYPVTYTSYDYGASLTESREITTKFSELKLQSIFLRSTQDFYKTVLVANNTDMTNNPALFTTLLQNPDTGAGFSITRQNTVNSEIVQQYRLTAGNVTLPQLAGNLVLNGKDSRIITTDLKFGKQSTLVYSTALIMTNLVVDNTDVLVIYGDTGETVEISLAATGAMHVDTTLHTTTSTSTGSMTFNFAVPTGITPIRLTGGKSSILVLVADYLTATTPWQPTIAGKGPFANFALVSATTPILVAGPHLVRTAALSGGTVALTSDLNATTTLSLFGPSSVQRVTWNGAALRTSRNARGALSGTLPGPDTSLMTRLPDLKNSKWRFIDSLPEITPTYDDSRWTDANHTETTSVFPRYYGGPWNLSVAGDYGFHVGNILWRGHFIGAGQAAVNLSISGGANFAASVWLNAAFLGSMDNQKMTNNQTFVFPDATVQNGKENVITVLQDHMGFNLAGMIVCCTPGCRQRDIQQPRGIEGYFLLGPNADPNVSQFTHWKVQGNFGGENFPDRTRKVFNEGGLFAERNGFHLPGFDDSHWQVKAPWGGVAAPGVAFFRTTFNLDLPAGFDIPLGFLFSNVTGHYRAQLYVNGWQMGKRAANLGPQTLFPVHPGILNIHGKNTVAVSLCSLGNAPADLVIPSLDIFASSIVSGGPGKVAVNNPSWKSRHAF